jgi:hypothetical protein
LGTAQKPQRRVQISPSSMKVAVLWFQHSPMFGHCADSHTVCRPSPRANFFKLWKLSPEGAFARSQVGLGIRCGGAISIWISWELLAMLLILPVQVLSFAGTDNAVACDCRKMKRPNGRHSKWRKETS